MVAMESIQQIYMLILNMYICLQVTPTQVVKIQTWVYAATVLRSSECKGNDRPIF